MENTAPVSPRPVVNIALFRRRAARRKAALVAFLQKLDEIVPEDFDELVRAKDAETWAEIDCTTCAHCCKTMTPTYSPEDIRRIAAHIGMTPHAFRKKWLYKEAETGDWMNHTQPCQFLRADNMCGIYEVRPADCAEFPHHNKRPFDDYNDTFIGNVDKCPATLTLVSKLEKAVKRDYVW